MRLSEVQFFQYQLPLRDVLQVKILRMSFRAGLLVKFVDRGGFEGWGEIAPLMGVSREELKDVIPMLQAARNTLLNFEWPDEPTDTLLMDELLKVFPPSVRCGLEMAFYNLSAMTHSTFPQKIWSPAAKNSISVNGLLTGTADEIIESARRAKGVGYISAKIKVGRGAVDQEAETVREVKKILGDVRLRLDANRSWTFQQAVQFAQNLKGLQIEYLEEPLYVPSQISEFVQETGVPVALDETLDDTPYEVWSQFQGVRAIILKPTIVGGFVLCRELAQRVAQAGMYSVVSSCFESGIGIMAFTRLAASLGNSRNNIPVGLDTYRWLKEDLLKPRLQVGPTIDLDFMDSVPYAVDTRMLTELNA